MRCKNCKARKMEGSEYPEEYCCIGIYDDELNEEYIIPGAFDERVCKAVAKAVAEESQK